MDGKVTVKNLDVSYYNQNVLTDINFSFKTGKLIGIIGPNGAGKSTLMKAMLGLVQKDQGAVFFNGEKLNNIRKQIAYVPQRANIDWDFPITVIDTVLLGTFPKLRLFQRPSKKDKENALHCLQKVGMDHLKDRHISELSGGQQQRVFLARALVQDANFLFLDEPFVGVDVKSEEMMMDILKTLRNEGRTIFIVHHDLSKIEEYFDDIILINKTLIASGPVKEIIYPELIKKVYYHDIPAFSKIGASS